MKTASSLLIVACTLCLPRSGWAQATTSAGPSSASRTAASMLRSYCIECHGPETQEAGLRLDTLADLVSDASNTPASEDARRLGQTLERVLKAVRNGKMPPEGTLAPSPSQRAELVAWLGHGLHATAESVRRSRGPRTRRMTVEEYNFTMQTLFGVPAEFADMLPPDPVAETGYRNQRAHLGLSSLQVEAYLDSARRAVHRYLQFGEPVSRSLRYQIEFEELFYATADRYETRARAPQPLEAAAFAARRSANATSRAVYIDPLGPRLPGAASDDEALRAAIPKLNQQYIAIPERLAVGELLVRIRAAGTADRDGRFPRLRVEAGITLGDGCSIDKRVIGEVDVMAPRDDPATYQFRVRLEDIPTKGPLSDESTFDRLSVFDMDQLFLSNVSPDPRAIFGLGRGAYRTPEAGSERIAEPLQQMAEAGCNLLYLDSLEIEMLPGVGRANHTYRWHLPSAGAFESRDAETAVARELLTRFLREAWRRPVSSSEIADKVALFESLRARKLSFEESLRETLVAVLVSPEFLFLDLHAPSAAASEKRVAAHQLASRLSYLLWLTAPDEHLRTCAADGSLLQHDVLRREAQRLMAVPRSRRFLESFCRQWLRLDKRENVAVDRQRYPSYDEDLAADCERETLAYFVDVFRSDASALDLIDSDYALLNDRLAAHYGLEWSHGGDLKKVPLPADSVRGGLLTQASLLTMNSDGADSHPIRRGVWLLDRLLNDPPPPPPPNVPEIDARDPDFRGLTLRQRIERHRQQASCRSCHEQIDPWGLVFENFDATGRWRDSIPVSEKGPEGNRRRMPVDASATLPGGQRIDGIVELKHYLREQRSTHFADALVHHLVTYAIGRAPDFADRVAVDQIAKRFRESDYRLPQLVLAIIESPLFRRARAQAAE